MTSPIRKPRAVFLGMLVGLLLLVASALQARPRVVWNATASTPVGQWRVLAPASRLDLRVGDYRLFWLFWLVWLFWLDQRSARLFARRGYLPRGVPLLKRVAAVAARPPASTRGRSRLMLDPLLPAPCPWTGAGAAWWHEAAAAGSQTRRFSC